MLPSSPFPQAPLIPGTVTRRSSKRPDLLFSLVRSHKIYTTNWYCSSKRHLISLCVCVCALLSQGKTGPKSPGHQTSSVWNFHHSVITIPVAPFALPGDYRQPTSEGSGNCLPTSTGQGTRSLRRRSEKPWLPEHTAPPGQLVTHLPPVMGNTGTGAPHQGNCGKSLPATDPNSPS